MMIFFTGVFKQKKIKYILFMFWTDLTIPYLFLFVDLSDWSMNDFVFMNQSTQSVDETQSKKVVPTPLRG